MEKKGISAIIGAIIVLLITIVIGGTTYFYVSNTLTGHTKTSFEIIDTSNYAVTIKNTGTNPITSFSIVTIDDDNAVYRVSKQDSSLIAYWRMDDFDPSKIKILVIENLRDDCPGYPLGLLVQCPTSIYTNQLIALGFTVIVDTTITTQAQVDSHKSDIITAFSHGWYITKFGLLNQLYDSGYKIYTEGDDNGADLRPISSATSTGACAGTIIPDGTHPITQGWTTTSNSGCSGRNGITAINPSAVAISRDSNSPPNDYIETIYLEENGKGKWFHHQPSAVPDDRLILNAVSFLVFGSIEKATKVSDSTQNSNIGTFGHAPFWVNGKFEKALKFDGVNDYVDAGNGASLNIPDAITIEAWVKPNVNTGILGIVNKEANGGYDFEISGGYLAFKSPGIGTQVSSLSVPIEMWSFVSVTFVDQTDKMVFYVNTDSAAYIVALDLASSIASVYIGNDAYNSQDFNGIIDELRIYNRALSDQEIKASYTIGSQINAGEIATIKIYNSLTKGIHNLKLCTSSMCTSGPITIN